ncbi:sugar transferase [Oscillatoria amoena NRMC-F 0135]|nr:sugar transferase [Oscillatoria amoena NRMC-F 0135]
MYRQFTKPLFDKFFALLILILASPVLFVIILLLAIFNRGKVWFIQPRPGKDEKPFRVIKFKTMEETRDVNGELLPDERRLTGIGKFIRKTSLDELPQLINVLRGEMSLVGPRPLLMEYIPLYNAEQRRRHQVKPGITGWAQVNGRNTVAWPQRFQYDVWYVDHQSFWLDLKILVLTALKVLKAEGISGEGSATMERFRGNTDTVTVQR